MQMKDLSAVVHGLTRLGMDPMHAVWVALAMDHVMECDSALRAFGTFGREQVGEAMASLAE